MNCHILCILTTRNYTSAHQNIIEINNTLIKKVKNVTFIRIFALYGIFPRIVYLYLIEWMQCCHITGMYRYNVTYGHSFHFTSSHCCGNHGTTGSWYNTLPYSSPTQMGAPIYQSNCLLFVLSSLNVGHHFSVSTCCKWKLYTMSFLTSER